MKEILSKTDWAYLHQTQTKKVITLIIKVLNDERDLMEAPTKSKDIKSVDKCIELAIEVSRVRGFDLCLEKLEKLYDRAAYKLSKQKEVGE